MHKSKAVFGRKFSPQSTTSIQWTEVVYGMHSVGALKGEKYGNISNNKGSNSVSSLTSARCDFDRREMRNESTGGNFENNNNRNFNNINNNKRDRNDDEVYAPKHQQDISTNMKLTANEGMRRTMIATTTGLETHSNISSSMTGADIGCSKIGSHTTKATKLTIKATVFVKKFHNHR